MKKKRFLALFLALTMVMPTIGVSAAETEPTQIPTEISVEDVVTDEPVINEPIIDEPIIDEPEAEDPSQNSRVLMEGENNLLPMATNSGTCGDNLTWQFDDTTGTLTISGTGTMGNYYIYDHNRPWYAYRDNITSAIINNGVKNIGSGTFYYCKNLESITIPESVTSIDQGAFQNCDSLTQITIPSHVTSIGVAAFMDCDGLTTITVPQKVSTIGNSAFKNCDNLTQINVASGNTNYKSNSGILFSADGKTLICYPKGKSATYYSIPNGVTRIEEYAFYRCEELTEIILPSSITSIGQNAFEYCTKLVEINIPETVTSIEKETFKYCYKLNNIILPSSITSIGYSAFEYCKVLTAIEIPEGISSLKSRIFFHCDKLAEITIPSSVTEIGSSAFSYCSNLTDVFYDGTENEWVEVTIGSSNDYLTNATFHFADPCENGHSEVIDATIDATCTKTGLTEGKHCSVCSAIILAQTEIPAKGHTKTTIPAKDPTCTETGLSEGIYCSVCSETLTAQSVIPSNGHTEATLPAKDPTCSETGLSEGVYCSVCNETLTVQSVIPSNGHTEASLPAKDPTCTETGLSEGIYCSVCKETITEQSVIPSNGHTEVSIPATEPTCTKTGLSEGIYCSVCKETIIEQTTVPANGHTETIISPAVDPTCTKAGLSAEIKCSTCDTVLSDPVEVPAKGHTETIIPATKPTCTETGLSEGVSCSVCNEVLTEQTEVAAKGHTEIIIPETPATTTSTGLTEGSYCDVCGKTLKEQIMIEMLPGLFSGGRGTEKEPYLIATTDDFLQVSSYLDSHFLQIANISLADISHTPIGDANNHFSGTYDGGGFKISSFQSDRTDLIYHGLFGYSSGVLKNIEISDFSVKGHSVTDEIYGGALVGYNTGTVSNCNATADISMSTKDDGLDVYAGGICGYIDYGTLNNCSFDGTVTASAQYVNSTAYAGGIAGHFYYSAGYRNCTDCINNGDVSAVASASSDAYAGGICATGASVSNSLNTGKITATKADTAMAGGIVANGNATSCKNTGEIYIQSQYTYTTCYAGGCVGISHNNGASYCKNTGYVHGNSTEANIWIGGVIGDGSAADCRNYGTVNGSSEDGELRAGGIVGSLGSGTVKRCVNYGDVSSLHNGQYSSGMVGGVVGIAQYRSVIQSCNYGTISGVGDDDMSHCLVGGVMGGSSDGTIVDCFNAGAVSLDFKGEDDWHAGGCGGVYGESDDTSCAYSYNVGSVSVTSPLSTIGGIQGMGNSNNPDKLEYCYALEAHDDPYAIEMTDAESKKKETYVGFDFENIWGISPDINNGRPYLITLPTDDDPNWYSASDIAIPVTGIRLSNNNLTMSVGDSETLQATILPANADNQSVFWASSSPDVVSVTQKGSLTAKTAGTSVITVTTEDGEFTASCVVIVSERTQEEYRINSITIQDSNGTPLDAIPKGSCLATISVTNLASQGNTIVLLAAYTSEGQYNGLLWVRLIDLPVGATTKLTLPIENASGHIGKLKAFTITSFQHPQPVGKAVAFPSER